MALATMPRCGDTAEAVRDAAANLNTVLARDVLLDRVWGHACPVDTRPVDVHVCWLREKIEPHPSRPIHPLTVRGIGYRFTA